MEIVEQSPAVKDLNGQYEYFAMGADYRLYQVAPLNTFATEFRAFSCNQLGHILIEGAKPNLPGMINWALSALNIWDTTAFATVMGSRTNSSKSFFSERTSISGVRTHVGCTIL
jgi:hypothetical protein